MFSCQRRFGGAPCLVLAPAGVACSARTRLPVTLLADDVGLGKTISAGLVASELICRSRVSKILIVCPKLLGPQWQEELQTKFGIPGELAGGRKLIDADPSGVGAVITTYHSARLYLDRIPEDRFEMLVLDEAHKCLQRREVERPGGLGIDRTWLTARSAGPRALPP
jgi:SNF2 family DNA or RNA helicase